MKQETNKLLCVAGLMSHHQECDNWLLEIILSYHWFDPFTSNLTVHLLVTFVLSISLMNVDSLAVKSSRVVQYFPLVDK